MTKKQESIYTQRTNKLSPIFELMHGKASTITRKNTGHDNGGWCLFTSLPFLRASDLLRVFLLLLQRSRPFPRLALQIRLLHRDRERKLLGSYCGMDQVKYQCRWHLEGQGPAAKAQADPYRAAMPCYARSYHLIQGKQQNTSQWETKKPTRDQRVDQRTQCDS